MTSSPAAYQDVVDLLRYHDLELERAAKAAALAQKYELQLEQRPESMRPFRERMVALHRDMEARHRACAQLFGVQAERLIKWRLTGALAERPVFMTVVADQMRMDSAAVVVFDGQRRELLSAASDATARAAHDVEAVIGDGPALDIAGGQDHVLVCEAEIATRWPEFGSEMSGLGVRTIVAVPLLVPTRRLGALCAYSHRPTIASDALATACLLADVLTNTVLLSQQGDDSSGSTLHGALFDDADYLSVVNQAVGTLMAQRGCDPDQALALLRARAFVEGISLSQVAGRVLEGRESW